MNRFRLGLILLATLTLGGCWDIEEVDRRNFVVALGVDALSVSEIRLTLQIAGPGGVLPPSSRGATAQPEFFTVATSAKSVLHGIASLQSETFKTLYFGQVKSVIIGEKLARRGVRPDIEFLARSPKIPRSVNLYVTREPVESLLRKKPAEGMIPGLGLREQTLCFMKRDQARPIELWRFISALDEPGEDPYAPLLSYDTKNETMVLAGEAIFRHDRLVGFLNPDQAGMFSVLLSHVDGGGMAVQEDENDWFGFRSLQSHTKIRPISPKLDEFTVKARVAGSLHEVTSAKRGMSSRSIKEIEQLGQKRMEKICRTVLEKLQSWEADPLGFGLEARVHYPEQFNRHIWRRTFARAKVDVSVKFHLDRTGLYY